MVDSQQRDLLGSGRVVVTTNNCILNLYIRIDVLRPSHKAGSTFPGGRRVHAAGVAQDVIRVGHREHILVLTSSNQAAQHTAEECLLAVDGTDGTDIVLPLQLTVNHCVFLVGILVTEQGNNITDLGVDKDNQIILAGLGQETAVGLIGRIVLALHIVNLNAQLLAGAVRTGNALVRKSGGACFTAANSDLYRTVAALIGGIPGIAAVVSCAVPAAGIIAAAGSQRHAQRQQHGHKSK